MIIEKGKRHLIADRDIVPTLVGLEDKIVSIDKFLEVHRHPIKWLSKIVHRNDTAIKH